MSVCKSPLNGTVIRNPHKFTSEEARKAALRKAEKRREQKKLTDDLCQILDCNVYSANTNQTSSSRHELTPEETRKASFLSGEMRTVRARLKDDFINVLGQEVMCGDGNIRTVQHLLILSMIDQARNGNVQAMRFIRDTIGEKPANNITVKEDKPDLSALDALFDDIAVAGDPYLPRDEDTPD